MKIALLGYGKMGQEIEKLALKRGHKIILVIDNLEDWENLGHLLTEADLPMFRWLLGRPAGSMTLKKSVRTV